MTFQPFNMLHLAEHLTNTAITARMSGHGSISVLFMPARGPVMAACAIIGDLPNGSVPPARTPAPLPPVLLPAQSDDDDEPGCDCGCDGGWGIPEIYGEDLDGDDDDDLADDYVVDYDVDPEVMDVLDVINAGL